MGRGLTALRGAGVAVVVALLLAARGRPGAGLALAILAVLGGQLLELRPRAGAGVTTAAGDLAHGIGWLLLAVVGLVVFTPVWLVSRVLGWDVLGAAARPRWSSRPAHRDAARRPFARERMPMPLLNRAHGAAVAFCVLALAGGVGLAVVRQTRSEAGPRAATIVEQAADPRPQPPPSGLAHSLIAHEGDPWAAALFREEGELQHVRDAYLTFRPADHDGTYINITDQERRSYVGPAGEQEPIDVWFFGSSALFGIGQRDDHTIPSEVVRLAEADGVTVRAHNFAMSGYVNWQETLLFAQLLTEREDPELVVFYDGANDIGGYAQEADPARPTTLFEDQVAAALADSDLASPDESTGATSATRFASVYDDGVELARDLGEAHGIDVVHFFQPSLGTKDLTDFDQPLLDELGWNQERFEEEAGWWDQAEAVLHDPVIPLLDVLDDAPEPVYLDQVHTDEVGAGIVAAAVYDHLRPLLEGLEA